MDELSRKLQEAHQRDRRFAWIDAQGASDRAWIGPRYTVPEATELHRRFVTALYYTSESEA